MSGKKKTTAQAASKPAARAAAKSAAKAALKAAPIPSSEQAQPPPDQAVLRSMVQTMLDTGVVEPLPTRPTNRQSMLQPDQLVLKPSLSPALAQPLQELVDLAWESAEVRQNALSTLKDSEDFAYADESALFNLKRFVTARDEFFDSHEFLTSTEFYQYCGFKDKNQTRKLATLKENHEVLVVQTGGKDYYPLFQLTREAKVHDLLVEVLPRLHQAGRTGWDICFWLFSRQELEEKRHYLDSEDVTGLSYEEVMDLAKKAEAQNEAIQVRPIDAIHNNDADLFDGLITAWIDQPSMKVPLVHFEGGA